MPKLSRNFAALALALSACSPASLLNATISRSGVTITHNVAYGPAPREKLDIYRPDIAGPTPVIVFFYGGSWNSGSKAMYPFVASTLARKGFAVVVPDYRLYPEVRFPAFLEDSARSVAWTQSHLGEIGGDPDRVFLMGHSAGAYNAVMLGLDAPLLRAAGSSRESIAGIVGLAGPYDFLPITGEDIKPIFASVGDGPESQPVSYVDGHAPPMLLLAGADDNTVYPRNTTALAGRIANKGGAVQTQIYPGVAHIGLITAIAPLFQRRAPVLQAVVDFVVTHKRQSSPGAGAHAAE
jgi:acetyl esterase/lipase